MLSLQRKNRNSMHKLFACSYLTGSSYKERHDRVGRFIHHHLMKKVALMFLKNTMNINHSHPLKILVQKSYGILIYSRITSFQHQDQKSF